MIEIIIKIHYYNKPIIIVTIQSIALPLQYFPVYLEWNQEPALWEHSTFPETIEINGNPPPRFLAGGENFEG